MLFVRASIVDLAWLYSSSRLFMRLLASFFFSSIFFSAAFASPMAVSAWAISSSSPVTRSDASRFSICSTIVLWFSSSLSAWALKSFASCSFRNAIICFRTDSAASSALARSERRSCILPSAAFLSSRSVSMAAFASSMAPSASLTSSSSPRILSMHSILALERSRTLRFRVSFSDESRSISLVRLSMLSSRSASSFSNSIRFSSSSILISSISLSFVSWLLSVLLVS
mmetsp:Transcript_24818/g.58900  ORF Transcript_24818/g.58900 Transcript_24818/m.58900 type:complete len:228 (-) Transcript_24818:1152-1835(-)